MLRTSFWRSGRAVDRTGLARRRTGLLLRRTSCLWRKNYKLIFMACVYVLHSDKTSKKYVGSSRENNPDKRLVAHNFGKTKSTKQGRPWVLIYQEICNDYTEARKRENFLKTGQGRKWIKEKFSKQTIKTMEECQSG